MRTDSNIAHKAEGKGQRVQSASRTRRGQTLVIAIMVMFILAVVGAVFIMMVARNLFRSERSSDTDVVAQIAEAGIRYADQMLTSSEDGADWRPAPDNHGVSNVPVYPDVEPVPKDNWQDQRDRYPDFQWTRAYWPDELGYAGPSGGFSTFSAGQGRFLLRVSYNPNPYDAFSKHIKIESIGRLGDFIEEDPTTWRPNGNVQLRREITAFKPIGITDYARFITNKDSRSSDFALGCPGFDYAMGRLDPDNTTHKDWYRGCPVRVNGNVTWYGDTVRLFLRGAQPGSGATAGSLDASTFVPLDTVEVSGDINIYGLDPSATTSPLRIQVMDQNGQAVGGDDNLWPSDHSDFSTYLGLYRDGRAENDSQGRGRGIKRLDAPLIDQLDPTNSVPRYLLSTLYSGRRVPNPGGSGTLNLGEWGWGRGIYIGNTRDTQDESETLVGGFTLRSDWVKPGMFMGAKSSGWVGPYYIPPGVLITLHPDDTDGDGQPDLAITRTDSLSRGRSFVWRDAWGYLRPEWGGRVTMPYPDPNKGRKIYKTDEYGQPVTSVPPVILDGNGVIYAEGNIRIRGMLPKGMQLTVVSNENIYIEGNLLKYRNPNTPVNTTSGAIDPWLGTNDTSTCGLALLARQNICVNTTQFFSPLNSVSPESIGSDSKTGGAPYHLIVSSSPDSRLRCAFDFGPWESIMGAQPQEWALYLRHSGQDGPTYINAWLNPAQGVLDYGLLHLGFGKTTGLPAHIWGIGDPQYTAPGWGSNNMFAGDVFPLDTSLNALPQFTTVPGIFDLLQIGLDQTTYTRNNYLMGGLAVQPMDVRIEAVLYAQEGSFFVIPGTWFNPNVADPRPSTGPAVGVNRPRGVAPAFPFYGDALDIRIIIDGAVSENVPAPVSDVEEWMSKWGRIPPTYGSSSLATAHPGEGFTILYDDHAGWPLSDLRANAVPRKPIRTDRFGRTLPFAPRLPTSASLIYFGDVM